MLVPEIYDVESIEHETEDVFTLKLNPTEKRKKLTFLPGQFNMLYHYGIGEAAISISGDPSNEDVLIHTIRAVGSVTRGMQTLQAGDEIGVRGPFGAQWPLSKQQCDVLVIAGGIGLAPLRPALCHLTSNREKYHNITLLYGTRNPHDIIFKQDLEIWQKLGMDINVTVDFADLDWRGNVGVVTDLIRKNMKSPGNTLVFICGPEIMIKFAIHELMGIGTDERNIFASLERNMQCAVGFCGLCQYGPYFICKNGPVFSYEQLKPWLMIKEL